MKIQQVERLLSQYGNILLKDVLGILKAETPYLCPKCKGSGELAIGDEDGRHTYKTCSLCNCTGYTKTEYVPQTTVYYTKKEI